MCCCVCLRASRCARVQIKINPRFQLMRMHENLYMFVCVLWFTIDIIVL